MSFSESCKINSTKQYRTKKRTKRKQKCLKPLHLSNFEKKQ